jgi:hypothetical protein
MPELRTAVMIVVGVSWQDLDGNSQTATGRIEDKSSGGVCLRLQKAVEVGAHLRIDSHFEQFVGIVRYCRREGRDFIIGVKRDRTLLVAAESHGEAPPLEPVETENDLPREKVKAEPGSEPRQGARAEAPAENRAIPAASPTPVPEGRSRDIRDWRRLSRRKPVSASGRAEPIATSATQEKEPGEERKFMKQKWLELASWRKDRGQKHEKSNGEASIETADASFAEESPIAIREKEISMSTHVMEKNASRDVPVFQVELLPINDVFRVAGITSPSRGYSVSKVIEMINSEHVRNISKEMKRAAVLMALDAAGVTVDQIQRDAKARQDALNAYEASQKKQAEAEWARKAEEITQIQSELESIKAHYTARIGRCTEALSRDKARFNDWVTTKDEVSKNMAEAVDLCLKAAVAETAVPVLISAASASASAGSASTKPQ